MPRNLDTPSRERREQRHVLGSVMGSTGAGVVVGGAVRDEYSTEVVVAEVELDLLPRSLDEKGRVRVHDRPVALEGEARGDADQQLLADADVEEAWVRRQIVGADRREDDRDPLVGLERRRRQ